MQIVRKETLIIQESEWSDKATVKLNMEQEIGIKVIVVRRLHDDRRPFSWSIDIERDLFKSS